MQSTEFRFIPLSGKRGKGKVAVVDAADYEWLTRWKWRLSPRGYATACVTVSRGVKKTIPMHRLLVDLPPGMVTDHINRDRLDNRRCNLRAVTRRENRLNSRQCDPDYAWPSRRGGKGGRKCLDPWGKHGLPRDCSVWKTDHAGKRWRGCIDANTNRANIPTVGSREEAVAAVLALYVERHGSLPPKEPA